MTVLLLGLTMSVTDMTVGTDTMTEGTTIVMLETDTMITTEAAVVLPTLITTVANATVVTKGEMRGPDTTRGRGTRCVKGGNEKSLFNSEVLSLGDLDAR